MKTHIFHTRQIKKAAALIQAGELVAFPTETVYGLWADATNHEALKKIFIAKGRPQDNPLIIHISDREQLDEIAKYDTSSPLINKVIESFWPGPLTLILKKTKKIPLIATGQINTVAIRMPSNTIARQLIRLAGVPIAAPSANISGKPSGTSFQDVFEDFDGKICGIIRWKDSQIGLESTVIDLTKKTPLLVRPWAISFEKLKKVLPDIELYKPKKNQKLISPGMKYKHYSPEATIILFEQWTESKMKEKIKSLSKEMKKIHIVHAEKTKTFSHNLYKMFRECDKNHIDYILISWIDEKWLWLALMNRIRKASTEIVRP